MIKKVCLTAIVSLTLISACSDDSQPVSIKSTSSLQYTGLLDSSANAYVTPPALRRMWNFEIKKLLPEGTEVTKGQQVAWLDGSRIQKNLREDINDIKTREQNLTNDKLAADKKIEDLKLKLAEARMNYEKSRLKSEIKDVSVALVDQQMYAIDANIAKDKVETLEKKIELEKHALTLKQAANRSSYERHKVRVDAQKRGIKQLDIKADQAGVLVYMRGWDGEPIKSGSRVYRGQSIVRIADLSKMQVVLKIPERDVEKIDFDAAIEVGIEAAPERIWRGKVQRLSDVYLDDESQIYAEVVVVIESPDADLMRPGGKARVTFTRA